MHGEFESIEDMLYDLMTSSYLIYPTSTTLFYIS